MKQDNPVSASDKRCRIVLVMVGLPARGKSYISKKVTNYMLWRGIKARMFNVGNHRREALNPVMNNQTADFFSPENKSAKIQRENIAFEVLDSLFHWIQGGELAIFDATNTTKERRKGIKKRCAESGLDLNIIFLESICNDPNVIASNCLQKIQNSPDYATIPHREAFLDLQKRISNYESVYEPIQDEEELSYIKLINLQSKIICYRIHGNIPHLLVAFLMSIHIHPRPIWLTRAGRSEVGPNMIPILRSLISKDAEKPTANTEETKLEDFGVGSNGSGATGMYVTTNVPGSPRASKVSEISELPSNVTMGAVLNEEGVAFAKGLSVLIQERQEKTTLLTSTREFEAKAATSGETDKKEATPTTANPRTTQNLRIYTSLLPRAIQTVQYIVGGQNEQWSALNMLDTGVCHGMTMHAIKTAIPEQFEAWQRDPFNHRIPGGESYRDLVQRLEPFITELERTSTGVLVVSHLSTLQVLYGYFLGCPGEQCPTLDIPQHTVIELLPNQYGWKEQRFEIDLSNFMTNPCP